MKEVVGNIVLVAILLAPQLASAGNSESYIGKIYSRGELPGIAFSDKNARTSNPKYLQVFFVENSHFLLAKDVDEQSSIVVDAKPIPHGQSFIGRPFEDECKSKALPNETIFVVGTWLNRKAPDGGFAGGYANPITKAWRVNFKHKKFEEIPTTGIKCEDNRTEADVN